MNPVLLDLGFVKIYWYSIMIFLGLLIGGGLALREAKKFKISEDFMLNLILFLIIFAVVGARIYFVIFNWSYYSNNLLEIFKIWEGGLAIHGAIIAGLIWVIIYTKKHKFSALRMLDILVVGLLIGQVIGRWGNFFNGEAHGPLTTLEHLQSLHLPSFIIEGMKIGGNYYEPTFLYESLWCLLGFIILLVYRRYKYNKIGQITGLYLIWYGIGRFFIESLRTDSLMLNDFKVAQVISIIMIICGVFLFIKQFFGSKLNNLYNDKENVNEVHF